MGATFGATVAAARLYGLDAEQTAHAIALTATSIGGLAKAANTSVAREYHAGLATMLGIEAVQAAQRGFTAEVAILEMEGGFCQLFGGPEADAAGITRDLGRDWDIVTDMAIKLVPGGHPYHAFAEAAANAARQGNISDSGLARRRDRSTSVSGHSRAADWAELQVYGPVKARAPALLGATAEVARLSTRDLAASKAARRRSKMLVAAVAGGAASAMGGSSAWKWQAT